MNTDQLAIYGGPRAVTRSYRERWRNVPWRALAEICAYGFLDINTRPNAQGAIASFENQFKALTDTGYALATNSGTAALHSAFVAVGVKSGHVKIAW